MNGAGRRNKGAQAEREVLKLLGDELGQVLTRNLTCERVRELFDYSPDDGALRRRVSRSSRRPIGSIPGSVGNDGRRRLQIDGRDYLASRVIWLHVHGAWPSQMIDHMNGKRDDNRIANLRDVSSTVNNQNKRGPRPENKTGYLGVSPSRKRFVAFITADGANRYLGSFDTPELAHTAYLKAKRELHEGCTI